MRLIREVVTTPREPEMRAACGFVASELGEGVEGE